MMDRKTLGPKHSTQVCKNQGFFLRLVRFQMCSRYQFISQYLHVVHFYVFYSRERICLNNYTFGLNANLFLFYSIAPLST